MATPTAVEILMAYLQHAYDGLVNGEEQVVSQPVVERFNFQNVLRGESFFRELLQLRLVEESGAAGIGHIYWLTPRGQALMERVADLEAAIRHEAGAKGRSDLVKRVQDAILLEGIKQTAKYGLPQMEILLERARYWIAAYGRS
jgi:hypothetical protein